jgi:hypothetical protein
VLAKYIDTIWLGAAAFPQVSGPLTAGGCSLEGLRSGAPTLGKCYEGIAGVAGPFGNAEKAAAAKVAACPAACAEFVKDAGAACAKAIDATFNFMGAGKPTGFVTLAASRIAGLCAADAGAPAAPRCAKEPFPNLTIPSKYNLGAPAPAASTKACCERCAAVAGCRAWTLNPKGACQLKTKNDYQYKVSGFFSKSSSQIGNQIPKPTNQTQPRAGAVLLRRVERAGPSPPAPAPGLRHFPHIFHLGFLHLTPADRPMFSIHLFFPCPPRPSRPPG